MRKLLVSALAFYSILANANDQFAIKGDIKGLKDSTLVFLTDGGTGSAIAQDYAVKGKFNLSGVLENGDLYQLNFIGYKDAIDVFMFNNQVSVTGNALALSKVVIKGAPLQDDYAVYQKRFEPLRIKLNGLVEKINKLQPGPKRDSLITQFQKTRDAIQPTISNFIKEKSASPVSAFVLFVTHPLTNDVELLETRFNTLKESAKKGIYGEAVISTLEQGKAKIAAENATAIGAVAPMFVQNDTANVPVSLASFKGKYVLLDFWASWCKPCRVENPNVVAAYQAFKDKNFTVLGISLDSNKENWIQAIAADNLTWQHVSDLQQWSNAVAQLYKVTGIPQNFLLDPEGKIVAKNLRGSELHSKLAELLK